MAEAVIVEAVRAPVGKRNGGLRGCTRRTVRAGAQRPGRARGVDPALVDDVIWGCVMQAGEQALDIARTAVLSAGWPETGPGVTVDRQCGSSQQSLHFAVAGVVAGHYDVVVAGGVESMSRTPMGSSLANGGNPYGESFKARYDRTPNQGVGAEMIAEQWGLSRTELDEFSLRSHEKAAAAQDSGAFKDQIVGIKTKDADGRHRRPRGRRHPPRRHRRIDGQDQAGLQGRRRDPRRQLQPDLRRLGRAADHVGRESRRAGSQAAGQGAHCGAGRCRPGHHADRTDPGHPEGAEEVPVCASIRSGSSRSTRRSRRCRWRG